ncbi:MAG: hypothetical protein KDC53_01295 [Saprospiraceae bacterium]|nr:hypothetical protein [Saprospiraceae bacterium]
MDPEQRTERKEQFGERPYYSDDIFHESNLPVPDYDDFHPDAEAVMPKWLEETRLVSFLVGSFGLLYTLINLDFFFQQIKNPFFLNLTLLMGFAGFANYMIYPNVLKYCMVNGLNKTSLLRTLNNFMIGFSLILFVFLFSFPVTGLGLSLILLPAPLIFGYFSRPYVDTPIQPADVKFSVLQIFNQDLRRVAWFSFTLIFLALIFTFMGVFLGII